MASSSLSFSPGAAATEARAAPEASRIPRYAPYHGQLHQEESPSSVCSAEGGRGVGGGTKRYWKGLSAPMPRSLARGSTRGQGSGPGAGDRGALHLHGPHVLRVVDADAHRLDRIALAATAGHPPGVHVGPGRVVGGREHGRQRHVQRGRQLRRDLQVVDRLLVGDGQPEVGSGRRERMPRWCGAHRRRRSPFRRCW